MRIERVRLPFDPVKGVDEPFLRSRCGNALRHAFVALHRSKLGRQIILAAHPFTRYPRIEKIGSPTNLNWNARLQRHSLVQTTLADKAPGTDNVGNDIDRDGMYVGCGHDLSHSSQVRPTL